MGLDVNILIVSKVTLGTSNLPLPRLDPEKLLAARILKVNGLNQAAQAARGGKRGGPPLIT